MTTLFDGPDVTPADTLRLGHQLQAVRDAMSDGNWHTLEQLARAAHCTTQSASARARDLRKARFGGHTIQRQRSETAKGVFLYRMVNHV